MKLFSPTSPDACTSQPHEPAALAIPQLILPEALLTRHDERLGKLLPLGAVAFAHLGHCRLRRLLLL